MDQDRIDLERNPLVLVLVFALVAAGLFVMFKFVAPQSDGADAAPTDGGSTTAGQSETSAEPGAPLVPEATDEPTPEIVVGKRLQKRVLRLVQRAGGTGQTVTTTGPLGEVTAPVGGPVEGQLRTSVANIPNTSLNAQWYSSIRTLIAPRPDFVTLNEVFKHPTSHLNGSAPGYKAFKIDTADRSPGASGQSLNNAIMYRADSWQLLVGGRTRVINDDRGRLRGRPFLWDRFITWGILQREDGAIVSLVSLHMPTNPAKTPTVPGVSKAERAVMYGRGMDTVVAALRQLSTYGPVLLGGDMNSHPGQGAWTAASKMAAAGFHYVKDRGVMYLFYQDGVQVVGHQQVRIYSDHPAIVTTLDMNGKGPATS